METKNVWSTYNDAQMAELETLCSGYRAFLNNGKTERECVKECIRLAEAAGYRNLKDVIDAGETLQAGDKVYAEHMKKTVALFILGSEPLEKGMRIVGSHIDSPRLDLKQNPLYEDGEMALLDTHYYGGIKKYQWVTIPLALHGVVAKKDGTVLEISIGEKEEDPVFCISDLLPHLGSKQMEKKGSFVVEGEDLNVLVGSRPLKDTEEKEAIAAGIVKILKEQYQMEEEDFISAEIEVVPAGKARDCGLDRSMILSYGQDDRVCAYTALSALLSIPPQTKTCCALMVDKEEIGSVGATGMQSAFFENVVAELVNAMGSYSELSVRRALQNSRMISSDVSIAYDPIYSSVFEKKNTAFFGHGVVFNKYTGARGKSGSNDANAEYIGDLRRIFEKHQVAFQTAEVGAVDAGGGGTIAYISALYGMEVIDSGVPVLSMHAPMEVASKADIYEAEKAYAAFLKEA